MIFPRSDQHTPISKFCGYVNSEHQLTYLRPCYVPVLTQHSLHVFFHLINPVWNYTLKKQKLILLLIFSSPES